jgi:hypothetical protein
MSKRTLGVLCVLLLIVGSASRLAYHSTLSKRVSISDVSQPWQGRFSNPIGALLNGRLRIEIAGHLDAPARLYYDGVPVDLPAGTVNHAIDSPEWWGSTCDLRYDPLTATSGTLSLRVLIGSCPDWTYHRPTIGDPEPAGYTGGWDTYYPGSLTVYCRGGYYHGKRDGEWEYFDERGRLLRTEHWQNGLQMR